MAPPGERNQRVRRQQKRVGCGRPRNARCDELWFISSPRNDEDVVVTLTAFEEALVEARS